MGWMDDPIVEQSPQVSPAAPKGGGFMADPEVSQGEAQYDSLINEAAQKYNLPVEVLRKQVGAESSFNPDAVSPAGAVGLMQLMPGTAKELGVTNPRDPAQNIDAGARYLRQQLDANNGDMEKALAAYNWGPGNLQKKGLENAPKETRDYLSKILGEVGAVADTSIRGGLSSFPQMVVRGSKQLSDMATEGARRLGVPDIPYLSELPSPTALLEQGAEAISSPLVEPQTGVGKFAGRVGQAAIGSVASPGGLAAPLTSLRVGTIAGVGSEAGGYLGELVGGDTGRTVGSVLGGVVAPTVASTRFANAKQRISRDALKNVDDYQLAVARARMEDARQQGINLTLPQAMPSETNLDVLQEMLVKTRAGEVLARQLREQPLQVQEATEQAVKGLPGVIRGQQETANIAQQQADAALAQLRQERTAAVTPLYNKSGTISPSDAADMLKGLREAVRGKQELNRSKTLIKLYNKLNPLKTVEGSAEKVRKPITNVQQIDDTLRELEKKLSNKPKDPRADALIRGEIGKIRDRLGELSPGYAEGSKEYARISREVINPAKQGPLGQVAQRTGYDPSQAANRTNLFGIFDRGSAEGGRSEILTLQKSLSKTEEGRQAFVDAGKSWLSDKVQGAMRMEGGKVSSSVASDIEKALYGTPAQIRGTRDVLAGMARSQGVPEKDVVDGMQNLMRTVRLAAKRPPSAKGLSTRELAEQGENVATKFANSSIFNALVNPLRRPIKAVGQKWTENADSEIARLLSTPEGISTLRELAKARPGSQEAYQIIQRWNAVMAASEE